MELENTELVSVLQSPNISRFKSTCDSIFNARVWSFRFCFTTSSVSPLDEKWQVWVIIESKDGDVRSQWQERAAKQLLYERVIIRLLEFVLGVFESHRESDKQFQISDIIPEI